jgi:hypothetical protein
MFKILRRRELQETFPLLCQTTIRSLEPNKMLMKNQIALSPSIVRICSDILKLTQFVGSKATTVKAVIISAFSVGIFAVTASAQPNITWQAPATISGTSDVSTQGTLVGTWGPGDDWGGSQRSDYYPVNGVSFAAYGNGPFGSWVSTSGLNDRYNGFANPGTGDANYNYLVQTAIYSYGSSISLTWNGLTPGNTYELEFWVHDGRNSVTAERSETLSGGANTSAPLSYGTGGSGPGQYILGTFVADGTASETLTLNASGGPDIGPSAQVNLLQLRNVTPRPNVTWRAPLTISGPSDVSTQGTYFGSWAPQDGGANGLPVNGVTFQGFSDLPYFYSGPTFDSGYNGYASPGTSDANYNTLLQYARYSNATDQPANFTWAGMTPGKTYLIQMWVNDARSVGQIRSETITGGANTSAPINYGSNPDGSGPGQFIIGTFVANSSGSQALILNSIGGIPPQINLFQVRDITPVITSIAVNGTTLSLTATNGPAGGPYTLRQSSDLTLPVALWTPVSTGSFDGNGNLSLSANIVNPANSRMFYTLQTQ